MASGMDLLLKSFGVDPEQIKSAVENMGKGVIQVNERLARIEEQQQEILRILKNGQPTEITITGTGNLGNDVEKTG